MIYILYNIYTRALYILVRRRNFSASLVRLSLSLTQLVAREKTARRRVISSGYMLNLNFLEIYEASSLSLLVESFETRELTQRHKSTNHLFDFIKWERESYIRDQQTYIRKLYTYTQLEEIFFIFIPKSEIFVRRKNDHQPAHQKSIIYKRTMRCELQILSSVRR